MEAAESHPEQDPRYVEMQRELQRRERELMREMARRKREVRRELMREIARRKEEMVGHCESQSVPAFLGLSRIHSDESSEDDFSEPWISFKELRINLEKDEEAEEMCDRQWMTEERTKFSGQLERRNKLLEEASRIHLGLMELVRREKEMVAHQEGDELSASAEDRPGMSSEWMKRKGLVLKEQQESEHHPKLESHTEGIKGYLTKKESDRVLRQKTWPPQSPDLNPIQMVRGELDRRQKAKGQTSAKHLSGNSFKTVGRPFQEERTKFSGQLETRNKLLEEARRTHLELMELVRREKEMVAHQEGDELSASAEDRPGMSSKWMKRKGLVLKKQQESEHHPELEEERTKFSGPLETTNKLLEEARRTHLHRRHLGLMELVRREKEMERKENELERRAMELDEREEEMDRRERELERRAMELVRREKEMDEHQEGDELSASAEDRPGMSSDESKKMPTEELKPVQRNSKELDPPSMSESGDKPSSSP